MKFDIVFVSYNSEKWLNQNIDSILKSDYNLKNISLYYYDNKSTDNSIEIIKNIKEKYSKKFNEINYIEARNNKGFGYGNNEGAKLGNSEYILFLNIDTEIMPDTFSKLEKQINDSEQEFAMWELSQRPYEHPKYFDPITGETSWASGACMVVRRDVFEKIGGFDKKIFMYCEDVDISWNFRKNGYKIKYLFDNQIMHYSYQSPDDFKKTQFIYGFVSNWYLRSKYGKLRNSIRGALYVYNEAKHGENIPTKVPKNIRKSIIKTLRKECIWNIIPYTLINLFGNKKVIGNFKPTFMFGLDYEIGKGYSFYQKPEIETDALVSIIVRTCNRKEALRENLLSIRNQSYKNIEVVIVEDGPDTSSKMLKEEFSDLNIVYEAIGKNMGRSHAANIAMKKAKGKYLNFLDDDDLFLPDHVETLVKELEFNNYEIVYDSSYETKVDVISKKPYKYELKEKGLWGLYEFSRKELYKHNLFPIQTVMFKKELFDECGGMDEKIDALEDWDFWVRLSLNHEFYKVENTTSIFRTPYNQQVNEERNKFLASTLDYLHIKFKSYIPKFTVEDINRER